MNREQALRWINQVGGTIYHDKTEIENAWVAVVRTPRASGRPGKIIMAFGESLETATDAAEQQWSVIWNGMTRIH